MKNISTSQMIAIMICCLFSRLMTYTPQPNDNAVLLIVSEAITFVMCLLLVIPTIAIYKKSDGQSLINIGFAKNKIIGYIIAIIFLLFCLLNLIFTLGSFTYSLQYSFSQSYATWAVIIVFGLSAVYVASMGAPACARTAAIIAVITIAGIALLMFGFNKNINFRMLNIANDHKVENILQGIKKSVAHSDELIFFLILIPYLKSKPRKTMYSYLIIKLIITTIVFSSTSMVLGRYALTTKLPFFSLSSYSKTIIVERFDAFFLLFWTLSSVLRVSITIICILECSKIFLPKVRKEILSLSFTILCGVAAAYIIMSGKWEVNKFDSQRFIVIVALLLAIPISLMLTKTRYTKSKVGDSK